MLEPIRHILSHQRIILASGSPRRQDLLKSIGLTFETIPSSFNEDLDKHSFSHPCEYVKENAKQKAIEVWNRLSLASSNPKIASGEEKYPDLVIGADTVVTLDGEIYEKPRDQEEAMEMLNKLSGQKHTVFTGVALVTKTKPIQHLRHSSISQPSSLESHQSRDAQGELCEQHSLTTDYRSAQSNNEQDQQLKQDQSNYLVTTFHESTDVVMTQMSADVIRAYIASGEPMDKAGAYAIQGNGATLIEQIRGDFYNVVGLPIHRLCRELYILHHDL